MCGGGVSGCVSIGEQSLYSFLSMFKFVFGGGVGVYWLCLQKCWYARQGWGGGGCDVLVCHRTIEFRLRYALFIVENVNTSHFELVMNLSYYCSLKS